MKTTFMALALAFLSASTLASTQERIESFWVDYCPTVKSIKQTQDLTLLCKMKDLIKNRQSLISFYRNISILTGDARIENWGALSPAERLSLQQLEVQALNISSALITDHVDEILDGKK